MKENSDDTIILYLVGNVIDKEDERQVSEKEAMELAEELEFSHYHETSAKTGVGIRDMFFLAARHIYNQYKDRLD